MPSRARRREIDGRSDRFESEIRDAEASKNVLNNRKELPQCGKCKRVFEEKSKYCPRCETKTMGLIVPVPERHIEEFQRNALRRLGRR